MRNSMKKLILTGAAVTVLVSGLSTAPAMADPVGELRDQGSASSGTSLPSSPNGPPGPGSGVDVTSKEIGDAIQDSSISKLPAPPAGENVPAPSEPVNPQTTLATPAAEGTTSDAINDVATGEMEYENEWWIDKSNRAEELLDLPEVVRLVSGSPRESIFTSGIGLEDDTGGDTDSDLDSDSISPTSSIGKILGALGIGLEDEGPGGGLEDNTGGKRAKEKPTNRDEGSGLSGRGASGQKEDSGQKEEDLPEPVKEEEPEGPSKDMPNPVDGTGEGIDKDWWRSLVGHGNPQRAVEELISALKVDEREQTPYLSLESLRGLDPMAALAPKLITVDEGGEHITWNLQGRSSQSTSTGMSTTDGWGDKPHSLAEAIAAPRIRDAATTMASAMSSLLKSASAMLLADSR